VEREYLVRAVALENYDTIVYGLGGDPAALMRAVGLSYPIVEPEIWISYARFLQLLDHSAQSLGCPHFGLLLSREQGLNALGTVGLIMQQASNVGEALGQLVEYHSFHNQGAEVVLSVDQNKALLFFRERIPGAVPWHQQMDLAAGIGVNVMRLLCATQWAPERVYLSHAAPENTRPYRELFRAPVTFDWEESIMVFPESDLAIPVSNSDPRIQEILRQHLSGLEQTYPDSYSNQIKCLIRQAMFTGDCSLESVAGYLSVNKRTLQRRLREEGRSFKELVEEVRFDQATRQLRESRTTLTELAYRLGYSELSTFSFAFKQRFGMSPREWRRQHAGAA
jgi:AraC-like DNA-binding protein